MVIRLRGPPHVTAARSSPPGHSERWQCWWRGCLSTVPISMRGRAAEPGEQRASGERWSCASRAGYFRGFPHDALDRSGIAVGLSTSPAFELKAGVGTEPRIRMKRKCKPRSWRSPFWKWEWDAAAPCFSSALGWVKPVVRAPSVLFTGQIYPPPLVSCLTYRRRLFGRHTVLRAACKAICGRKMRPVVFCAGLRTGSRRTSHRANVATLA